MSSNKPTPSFNTVKKSNRQSRRQRQKYSRLLLLAILAISALLVLTLLVFGVCLLVDTLTDDPLPPTPSIPGNETNTAVEYEQITQPHSAIRNGILINVNKQHAFDFQNKINLINIAENRAKYQEEFDTYQVVDQSWLLEANALNAFNAMMLKYYEVFGEEEHIWVVSAYRSYTDQLEGSYDSLPGYSDHHTGLCIAIKGGDSHGLSRKELEEDHWIYQNCHKYGYVVRYPKGKEAHTGVRDYSFCLRYVGIEHATYMAENNLCLEEYTQLLANTATFENPLQFQAADGKQYSVYYIKSESDLTTVCIPKGSVYAISGDNVGGFIVTVHLSESKNA